VVDHKFNELGRFLGKIKPEYENQWSEDAEVIHKIPLNEARNFNASDRVLSNYIRFIGEFRDPIFVCHARPIRSKIDVFDYQLVFHWFFYAEKIFEFYKLFRDERCYSTIHRSPNYAKATWGVQDQKLSTWMDKLNIPQDKHHDAMFDAEVCLEILKFQKQQGSLF